MGTILSVQQRESTPDPWWPNHQILQEQTVTAADIISNSVNSAGQEQKYREELATSNATTLSVPQVHNLQSHIKDFNNDSKKENNQKKLEVFKQELAMKREARQKAIAALTDKLKRLQLQVKAEEQSRNNAENEVKRLKELLKEGCLKEELDKEKLKVAYLEKELKNERKLRQELEREREGVQEKEQQIRALREVASIGKEMLRIRELQVNELKKKLCETQYPEDLREEYEAQIQNVKKLKNLYEERAEAVRLEHQREIEKEVARIRVLETKISELEHERNEAEIMREHLKGRVLKLDQELEERNDTAVALQEQLDASIIECRDLASQMNLINNLFSRMLVGNLNVDQITHIAEENQSLVTDLTTNEKKNDLASLLIDIARRIDDNLPDIMTNDSNDHSNPNLHNNNNVSVMMTQHDVALNLSKVWRILVKLLLQDSVSSSPLTECDSESCYKSVETTSGKRSVISVSQTFLTLKNLILEKNALIKEVNKLKLLNQHLESRLGNQEKRLSIVSTELKKTWGVVSKLQIQHKQLHTQETILKYELQHKRLLLNDLKNELERCKEIWDMARKKNCQSEEEWRKLRKEFADRHKNRHISNSAESGYEDDEPNSPPTEDSINEQNLDRFIDHERDPLLIINGELSTNPNFINESGHVADDYENSDDNYQNDSDITVEKPEQKVVVARNKSVCELSNQITEINGEEELIDCEATKSVLNETNKIKQQSILTNSSSSNSSVENISRFLEGLLTADDKTVSCKISEGGICEMNTSSENHTKVLKVKNSEISVIEINDSNSISKDNLRAELKENTTNELSLPQVNSNIKETNLNERSSEEASSHNSSCPNNQSLYTTQKETEEKSFKQVVKYGSDNFEPCVSSDCEQNSNNGNEIKVTQVINEYRTTEEVLDARTERLKKLEEQCKSLFNKVAATTIKSNVLSNKLKLLHEQYGRSTDSLNNNINPTLASSMTTTSEHDDKSDNISRPNIR